ncbi:Cytochrome c oxidase assembly protein COX16-like protein, mitochondrial [Aphelenchoides fujianensis]|nr:Cytochrome c oxidase assembly protein COX16-like protein, mitochondrial [Aphelenchoides fujianensis]
MGKGEGLRLLKVGLPFFTLVFGSAFALHYFQKVRYEFRRSKQEADTIKILKKDLTDGGLHIKEGVTVDSLYNEIADLDTENWENVRGPRDFEDNRQYMEARRKQQAEADARRRALRQQLYPNKATS